jgi:hypothetical protein
MEEAEEKAATEFVDELVQFRVPKLAQPGHLVLANGALFTVPLGQTGQYQVISNMKTYGQNECIGQHPVFLRKAESILSIWSWLMPAKCSFNFLPARRSDAT